MADDRFDVIAEIYLIADEQEPAGTPVDPEEQDDRLETLVRDLLELELATGNAQRDARLDRFRQMIQTEHVGRAHDRILGRRP